MPIRDREESTESTKTPLQKFRKHFKQLSKPEEPAKLPGKISIINSEKLSDLQNMYAAWREFTEDLIIDALAESTSMRHNYEYEFDIALLKMIPNCKTKVEAESKTRVDAKIRKLSLSLSESELYYKLLCDKLESYNNVLATISREITRRSNKI